MTDPLDPHDHVFLGRGHEANERKTWAVIALCTVMMAVEIIGGHVFGSLALVADGLHMSTHAGAMLIAALAYTYARRHAGDPRFVFGTGKLGDLAGFTSAVVLALIAVLIAYEAIQRFLAPVVIEFRVAIPIACVGLAVNVASAWLLSGHDHGHDHHDDHDHNHDHDDDHAHHHEHEPAPHEHGRSLHRDNNIRSAYVHVLADAAVSVLAIVGLALARSFGWIWMDPAAGLVGAAVILSWSYRLLHDTGAILLDMNPDRALTTRLREAIEGQGDRLVDLHLWRLGPGHLGVVLAVVTTGNRDTAYYRGLLRRFEALSHVTVEVRRAS
ncbi:MAG: CDF family Co(II)/Ni(II) efflux transporter DmeF [Gammaproteobacteria bacterium]|nr:CDF family Co(II)/Ni(II) efflux transporter DmeF [Gammaproteobacteria bacterium]